MNMKNSKCTREDCTCCHAKCKQMQAGSQAPDAPESFAWPQALPISCLMLSTCPVLAKSLNALGFDRTYSAQDI